MLGNSHSGSFLAPCLLFLTDAPCDSSAENKGAEGEEQNVSLHLSISPEGPDERGFSSLRVRTQMLLLSPSQTREVGPRRGTAVSLLAPWCEGEHHPPFSSLFQDPAQPLAVCLSTRSLN